MKLWILLPICVRGQYVGTLSLDSSLERSNRKLACPLESVSLTCSISGTVLVWEIQEGNTQPKDVGIFRSNDSAGHTFFVQNHFSCHGEIITYGALDYIDPRQNIFIRNSSMTIRLISLNESSHCDPIKAICKPGAGTNAKSMTYKIASELYHTVCHNSQVININIRYAGSVLLLICTFLSYKPDNFPTCFFNIGRPRASCKKERARTRAQTP